MAAHVDDVCIKRCLHAKAIIQCDVHDSDNEDEDTIDVDVNIQGLESYRIPIL